MKRSFYVSDFEHVTAVEKLINEEVEKVILDDEIYHSSNAATNAEKLLSKTKFKLGIEYAKNGKKEQALKELDDALRLDTDNVIIAQATVASSVSRKVYSGNRC